MVFAAAIVIAGLYVAYVLWPRWPDAPVALDAPSLPIVIAGAVFNIEPAAIRMNVQRRPGTHERVDLSYLWPSLVPPDPTIKPTVGAPVDPNERLFVTIASGDATLPLIERVQTIYPRYLVAEPVAGPPGLTFRGFRDDSPYQGEDLVFESARPSIFWRAARARASSIRGLACWSGASAMPTSPPLSARLADRLAKRRERHRPPDRATASELTEPLLGVVLNSPDRRRGSAIREYRTGGLFRFPETAPR